MPRGPEAESAGKFFLMQSDVPDLALRSFHVGVGNSDFCGKPLQS